MRQVKKAAKSKGKPKAKSKAKSKAKAKRVSRSSAARKPAARVRKTAKPRAIAQPASRQISVADWREETLARMRSLILEVDPEIIEERKWRKASNAMAGVPVWSRHGIICTGESYRKAVKLTFARGATLPDPSRLFNSSLGGNTRRAIDIHEGEQVDADAFKTLVKAAVDQNASAKKP
jgi:hypothetical protein